MFSKYIYISLFLLLFFLGIEQSFAVGFMDKISQPHLAVVPYNEVLEKIKAYTLAPVSIFNDEELKMKWANVLLSIGVLVILAILGKIAISIVTGSNNNLKKDITYLILLFFIATIFTPFFSIVSQQISGTETFYKDKETNKEYARVYLPANTAFVVRKTYIDKKGIKHNSNEIFEKRKNVFTEENSKWGNDYLGIPAKVIQTQWVDKGGSPEARYSKAFYSVSVDELFKGMKWPITALKRSTCNINVNGYLKGAQGEGAPLSFAEALGKGEWEKKIKDNKRTETIKSKYTGEVVSNNEPYIQEQNCSLGLFLLSNEYASGQNFDLEKENNMFKGDVGIQASIYDKSQGPERLDFFREISRVQLSTMLYKNEYIKNIWSELSYAQQKRLVYTNEAINQLFKITRYTNKKIKNDIDVKQAQLACGRIITGATQGYDDFRKCLKADVFGDTTIYTQGATKYIGLLGKNKNINKGYVFPVPQGQDWNGPMFYRVGRDLLSFIKISNYNKKGFQNKKEGSSIESDSEAVKTATYQENYIIKSDLAFSQQNFLPQLASFEAYDINGDGKDDRIQWKDKSKLNLTSNYFAYFYGFLKNNYFISLQSKDLDYLKTPIYEMNKVKDNSNSKIFTFLGEKPRSVGISQKAKALYPKTQLPIYQYKKQQYFFVPGTPKTIESINPKELIVPSINGEKVSQLYPYNPIVKRLQTFNSIVKNKSTAKYFLINDFNFYLYDKNMKKSRLLSNTPGYSTKVVGYRLSPKAKWNSFGQKKDDGEYLIRIDNNNFYYCKDKKSFFNQIKNSQFCPMVSTVNGLSYSNYSSGKLSENDMTLILSFPSIPYVIKRKDSLKDVISQYKDIYIPNSNYTYSKASNVYSYDNLKTGKKIDFTIPESYRSINQISVDNIDRLNNIQFADGGLTKKGFINLYSRSREYGFIKDVTKYEVNFDKLGQIYPSGTARILLNPKYNEPLKYTPANEHYLPEYKRNDSKCIINTDYTTKNKNYFDYIPGKPKDFLDKCSLIGNHMRLSDIRLINYVQQEAVFNISPNSESFTHIYIPLISNSYIQTFTKDRRKQNYAGEAQDVGGLLNSKKISGIKIKEGDIIVLKPGVLVGAYSYPFTLLVPKKVLPYLNFVSTDNPLKEKLQSKVYTGGLYSMITGLIDYFLNGKVTQNLFGTTIQVANETKYTNFAKDKLGSRPDSLKTIEGVASDKYFSAYYGTAYFGPASGEVSNSLLSTLSSFLLNIVSYVLQYRVIILKLLYILGPLLVFSLFFDSLRKIFTGALTIIISLLLLPIIVIIIVNIFN